MEMIEPMLLVDVENNHIDYEIMDDHAHVFYLTTEMALHGFDATQWDAVMQAEVDVLNQNKIWTLVAHPKTEKSFQGKGLYQEN